MENKIEIFTNTNFGSIRTLSIDGEPYFVGKDVAKILGYERGTKAVTDRVDEDDRLMVDSKTQSQIGTELGQRGGWLINESGLYSLILSSKLPTAKKFKHWVTSEVLPSIRKHGMYATDELLNNPDFAIKVFTELKKEKEKSKQLELQNEQQRQIIGELQPKADYMDMILRNKSLVTVSQIAKDYGMTAQELNSLLHDLGIQYKRNNQWLLYEKYQSMGYTHSRTYYTHTKNGCPIVNMTTQWTQKGRLFLYEKLKSVSKHPLIELAE